ncbi:MAG TPA: DEAD/DEAH box helicase family protein, partial [Spirochaetia bacterium]|nr:DEAD/DEAH box helicase family protein [Spirochaetia bacterium]
MEQSESYLVTGGNDPFLPRLIDAIDRASEIDIAVSFVKSSGLELLIDSLETFIASDRFRRLRILTSDYLYVTDPQALRTLLVLVRPSVEVKVFEVGKGSFHLKAYIFARQIDGTVTEGWAYVGSSNVTAIALTEGLEWNYRTESSDRRGTQVGGGFEEIRRQFESLFHHQSSIPLDFEWIKRYEARRPVLRERVSPGSDDAELPIPVPNSVQLEALSDLRGTRTARFQRGLVVMATGLGKTHLAAFDARQCDARKILFVAHREEILFQARRVFTRIFPQAKVGSYSGQSRERDADFLFASIQTLGAERHLEGFAPDHFDYIVVDEFHHAAAASYRRLLQHFRPKFLLGLTATPDRTDRSDILSFCDDNLVFDFDLFRAIRETLLCPFHYYGILDRTVEYREIPWRNGKFDPGTLSNRLATLNRAKHV